MTNSEQGFVVTTELLVVCATIAIGLAVGLSSVRDAVVSELSDMAGSAQDLNQHFLVRGVEGGSAATLGSSFNDALDFCDSPDDIASQADNCITFDAPPENEASVGETQQVNGNFEEGVDPANAVRTFGRPPTQVFQFDSSDVPDWQTTAPDGVIEIWESGFGGVDSQDGDYHAEINANTPAQLFQEFSVSPGDTIEYSVWHRGRSGVDVANVLIGPPGMQAVQQVLSTGNTAWVQYTGTYTVPAGVTTVRIGFESVSTASGSASSGNFIDNFSATISN